MTDALLSQHLLRYPFAHRLHTSSMVVRYLNVVRVAAYRRLPVAPHFDPNDVEVVLVRPDRHL